MKMLTTFFLIAVAAMSCSGEEFGRPVVQSLFKRHINCPPGAICLPATHSPLRVERSPYLAEEQAAVEGDSLTNPIIQVIPKPTIHSIAMFKQDIVINNDYFKNTQY